MKYTNTAKLFAQRREKKGITQGEISEKLNYAKAKFISNFERGYSAFPIAKMSEMRKILGITKAELSEALHQDFDLHIKKDLK
jgi:ribosome-binding protein aMBF1 (putative translation factor)